MEFVREKLELPDGADKLLLHSCCAPCSGEVMEAIIASEIDFTIFFYNPNIHPRKEYDLRKDENIRFAEKHNIPFVDADYDVDNWFEYFSYWAIWILPLLLILPYSLQLFRNNRK